MTELALKEFTEKEIDDHCRHCEAFQPVKGSFASDTVLIIRQLQGQVRTLEPEFVLVRASSEA